MCPGGTREAPLIEDGGALQGPAGPRAASFAGRFFLFIEYVIFIE